MLTVLNIFAVERLATARATETLGPLARRGNVRPAQRCAVVRIAEPPRRDEGLRLPPGHLATSDIFGGDRGRARLGAGCDALVRERPSTAADTRRHFMRQVGLVDWERAGTRVALVIGVPTLFFILATVHAGLATAALATMMLVGATIGAVATAAVVALRSFNGPNPPSATLEMDGRQAVGVMAYATVDGIDRWLFPRRRMGLDERALGCLETIAVVAQALVDPASLVDDEGPREPRPNAPT